MITIHTLFTYGYTKSDIQHTFLQRAAMRGQNARIASAVLATAIPSVCPSVHLSHAGIVSKRRHVAWCSLHWQTAKCV